MYLKNPYRVFVMHRGEKLAWCGFAGRYWFAKLPSAAVVNFPSHFEAQQEIAQLMRLFDRFAMIRPAEETVDGSGVEYVLPQSVSLFVD